MTKANVDKVKCFREKNFGPVQRDCRHKQTLEWLKSYGRHNQRVDDHKADWRDNKMMDLETLGIPLSPTTEENGRR